MGRVKLSKTQNMDSMATMPLQYQLLPHQLLMLPTQPMVLMAMVPTDIILQPLMAPLTAMVMLTVMALTIHTLATVMDMHTLTAMDITDLELRSLRTHRLVSNKF